MQQQPREKRLWAVRHVALPATPTAREGSAREKNSATTPLPHPGRIFQSFPRHVLWRGLPLAEPRRHFFRGHVMMPPRCSYPTCRFYFMPKFFFAVIFWASLILACPGQTPQEILKSWKTANESIVAGHYEIRCNESIIIDDKALELIKSGQRRALFLLDNLPAQEKVDLDEKKIKSSIVKPIQLGKHARYQKLSIFFLDTSKYLLINERPPLHLERNGDIIAILEPDGITLSVYDISNMDHRKIFDTIVYGEVVDRQFSEFLDWMTNLPNGFKTYDWQTVSIDGLDNSGGEEYVRFSLRINQLSTIFLCDGKRGFCPRVIETSSPDATTHQKVMFADLFKLTQTIWKPSKIETLIYRLENGVEKVYYDKKIDIQKISDYDERKAAFSFGNTLFIADRRMFPENPLVYKIPRPSMPQIRSHFFRPLTAEEKADLQSASPAVPRMFGTATPKSLAPAKSKSVWVLVMAGVAMAAAILLWLRIRAA